MSCNTKLKAFGLLCKNLRIQLKYLVDVSGTLKCLLQKMLVYE